MKRTEFMAAEVGFFFNEMIETEVVISWCVYRLIFTSPGRPNPRRQSFDDLCSKPRIWMRTHSNLLHLVITCSHITPASLRSLSLSLSFSSPFASFLVTLSKQI